VVGTLGGPVPGAETADVHIREEAGMATTVDKREPKDRTVNRLADLAEDAAFVVMLFSGIVMVAALVAAFFV